MVNNDIEYIELFDYICECPCVDNIIKNIIWNYKDDMRPLIVCIDEVLSDIYKDIDTMICRFSCDRKNSIEAHRKLKYKDYVEDCMTFILTNRINYLYECYKRDMCGNG